jgi:hypothetical protein
MKEEKQQSDIHNPHDTGYKYLLSFKKVFVQLLKNFIKEGWTDMINESAVMKIDKSYILQDFNQKEADVVYRVDIKGQEVIFYILMELQSTVDFQMPYRLLLYMVEIWRDVLKNTKRNEAEQKEFKLPVIVPIVLYNGENNWTAKMSYKETLSGYELFGDYVLDFKYILIDVNRFKKEDLAGLSNIIGTAFLLDQKYDTSEIYERLEQALKILSGMSPEDFSMLKPWLTHIFANKLPAGTREKIEDIISKADIGEVSTVIYNLERTLEEEFQKREAKGEARGEARGRAEGEARGRAEGRAEGKAELIIKLLKKKFAAVPEEYIEKIKKQDNDVLEAIGDNILNMQDINELDKYLKE